MELDVSRALAQPGQSFSFSGAQAIAPQEIYGTIVTLDDCSVEGTFMADDEGNISVRGWLETTAHAPCANCLKDASARIRNDFDEEFIRNGDQEDDEIFAYEGRSVNLSKLVMSYAVMALPIRFLCRAEAIA